MIFYYQVTLVVLVNPLFAVENQRQWQCWPQEHVWVHCSCGAMIAYRLLFVGCCWARRPRCIWLLQLTSFSVSSCASSSVGNDRHERPWAWKFVRLKKANCMEKDLQPASHAMWWRHWNFEPQNTKQDKQATRVNFQDLRNSYLARYTQIHPLFHN